MFKFLHISDLHIGKRLNSFSLYEDQRFILSSILNIAKERCVDSVFISGDIFDNANPGEEAISVVDDFLASLNGSGIKTFVIYGNHDPMQKLSYLSSIVEKQGLFISKAFNGCVEKKSIGEVDIYMLPFIRPVDIRTHYPDKDVRTINDAVRVVLDAVDLDSKRINILLSHQFITSAEGAGSEEQYVGGEYGVDYHLLEDFDYVALGHIHGAQSVGLDKIRYCGSPLKYSISEKRDKVCIYGEISKDSGLLIEEIGLKPLRDIILLRGCFDEIINLPDNSNDYIHITLTDEEDVTNASLRLSNKFPYYLGLVYDNSRTRRERKDEIDSDHDPDKSPLEYFMELFRKQTDKDLSEKQLEILGQAIEDIWRTR